jgi:hypothetical protein
MEKRLMRDGKAHKEEKDKPHFSVIAKGNVQRGAQVWALADPGSSNQVVKKPEVSHWHCQWQGPSSSGPPAAHWVDFR